MRSKLNKILNVTNEELNSIDLYKYTNLIPIDLDYYKYMLSDSGREHYRLLAYISSLFENEKLLDIGTNRGFSAIALADNKLNKVVSYDLEEYNTIAKIKNNPMYQNIEFKLGDFLELESLNDTKFIMLDTAHDGYYEEKVINHLKKISWSGLLLMDDINHTFVKLTEVWNSVELEKYDLTKLGHYSGTGLVVFE
jgi:predicted O-methyltransferase YrrM